MDDAYDETFKTKVSWIKQKSQNFDSRLRINWLELLVDKKKS